MVLFVLHSINVLFIYTFNIYLVCNAFKSEKRPLYMKDMHDIHERQEYCILYTRQQLDRNTAINSKGPVKKQAKDLDP